MLCFTQVTCSQDQATQVDHKYKMRRNWDTIFVLPKFRLVRVLLFIEGAMGDPTKVSPRGYHEGHSSRSLFQLIFLLPLNDSEAAESTITNFPKQPQSLGCSPATPSRLGPKSPRVTNANHEIDNMHKCASGGFLSILNLSQPTNWFGNLDHTLTKRGFGRVGKAQKCARGTAESPASKGWGLEVFIAPLKN